MRVSLKICMFSGVFALLAGVFLSQAHAASDDPVVVTFGKQSVQINPQPRIDVGEPGDDPHKAGVVLSAGLDMTQDTQVAQSSGASPGTNPNRWAALQRFLLFWLRQLFR